MRKEGQIVTNEAGAGSPVFDSLVSALSGQERQDLLARIRFSQVVEEAPLRDPEPTPEDRFDRLFAGLGFFERFLLFVRTVLTGKDRVLLVSELGLRRIARTVSMNAGRYFSSRTLELQGSFFDAIEELRQATGLFRKPLREALGANKKDFVAFLAGTEMPIVQEHLLREADPANHDRSIAELSEFDMKRALDSAVQDALDEISETDRQMMYRDIQLLHWLKDLADFSFDRILARASGPAGGRSCPAATIVGPMKEFAALLARLTVPPTTQLVGVLFLFAVRERLDEKEFNLEESLHRRIEQARDALSQVRHFNATVPLNDMIRLVLQDADWMPALRGGGEDWFVLYKQFWNDRLEERVSEFCQHRRRRHLLEAALKMLHLANLPYLRDYRSVSEGIPIRYGHEHSVAFLRGFLEQVYEKELGRPVKVFLLDGKFFKEQNRKDFADACNTMGLLTDRIRALEAAMSDTGHYGSQIAQIRGDDRLPATRAKAIAGVAAQADREAGGIAVDGRRCLSLLQLILDGILHGHGEETYDTISNLDQIGGRDNARLLASLRVGLGRLAAANEIMAGLVELEGIADE